MVGPPFLDSVVFPSSDALIFPNQYDWRLPEQMVQLWFKSNPDFLQYSTEPKVKAVELQSSDPLQRQRRCRGARDLPRSRDAFCYHAYDGNIFKESSS